MKKAFAVLTWTLVFLTLLFPAGALASACCGYRLIPISVLGLAAVEAVLSAAGAVLSFVCKDSDGQTATRVASALLAPLSLINVPFCILEEPRIPVIVCALLAAAGCCCVSFRCGKPLPVRIALLGLSALLTVPIGLLSFFALVFGNFGRNTVVRTLESPSGVYCARVIDSDQGALGGNTFVDVYEPGVDLFLVRIEKAPKRVYSGAYGAYRNLRIFWKDDHCLIVGSEEYPIE